MELLKKNQWTMKKFFKGLLLISSMLLTSSCTINQCTLELHDGDKVEQKSCRTKGKQLGKNYAIYNNKIWFVTANYDFYHGDEIGGGGGGCPNPSCFNLSLPSITVSPNVTSEKYIYTLLPLDVNKARVLMSNYITDGEKVFYSGKEISNINAKFFNAMIWYPVNARLELAWDNHWLYIESKKTNVPVNGEVKIINDSVISSGNESYLYENEEKIFKKIDHAMMPLYALPGPGLTTDGKNLFYRDSLLESQNEGVIAPVSTVCPVPGYPFIKCQIDYDRDEQDVREGYQSDTHVWFSVIRTNSHLWVQYDDKRLPPVAYEIKPLDNIIMFKFNHRYYIIINDRNLYSVNHMVGQLRDGKNYQPSTFSGFLVTIWHFEKPVFIDEHGAFDFNYGPMRLDYDNKLHYSLNDKDKLPNGVYKIDRLAGGAENKMQRDESYKIDNYVTAPFILRDNTNQYKFIDGKLATQE